MNFFQKAVVNLFLISIIYFYISLLQFETMAFVEIKPVTEKKTLEIWKLVESLTYTRLHVVKQYRIDVVCGAL